MTGDFESVIDTQFVAFNDRADKNLHEDTSMVRFFILWTWNNWIEKLKCSRKHIGIVLGENWFQVKMISPLFDFPLIFFVPVIHYL